MEDKIDIWSTVLNYSEYSKGGKYSASNIINPPLITALQLKYPHENSNKLSDEVKAWVGNSVHLLAERSLVGHPTIKSEYKVIHKDISGTIDLVIEEDGEIIIGDFKTSTESNMKKYLKDPTNYIKQLSIYRLLYYKQEGVEPSSTGRIYWMVIDKKTKYGMTEIELMSFEDTTKMIKDFLSEMKQPIEQMKQCDECTFWRYRFCKVRNVCHWWGLREDSQHEEIDTW